MIDLTDRGDRTLGTVLPTNQTGSPTGLPAAGSAQAAAFESINKALGPGGLRIETLGSDAQRRGMSENGIEEHVPGYSVYGRLMLGRSRHPWHTLRQHSLHA